MAGRESAENLRLARVGDVENGGSLRPVLMADIGVIAVDNDLSASGKIAAEIDHLWF